MLNFKTKGILYMIIPATILVFAVYFLISDPSNKDAETENYTDAMYEDVDPIIIDEHFSNEVVTKPESPATQGRTPAKIKDIGTIERLSLTVVPPKEWEPGFGRWLMDPGVPTTNGEMLVNLTFGNYTNEVLENEYSDNERSWLPNDYSGAEISIHYDNGLKPNGAPDTLAELLTSYLYDSSDTILKNDADRILVQRKTNNNKYYDDHYEVRRLNNDYVIVIDYLRGTDVALEDVIESSSRIQLTSSSRYNEQRGMSEAFLNSLE